MKIKLAYPKIPDALHCLLKQCVAFEKLDGTNIHFVWKRSPEMWNGSGFSHFGTRRDRFETTYEGNRAFEQAHPELKELLGGFDEMLMSWDELLVSNSEFNSTKEIIVFAEYFGPNSFAGSHDPKDKKQLTIIDVQVDGAMLPPDQFIQLFEPFGIPKVVYKGKFTGQLFMDVRNGKYDVKEGVVVKGVVDKQVQMVKIKTNEYLKRLKEYDPDKWKDHWE